MSRAAGRAFPELPRARPADGTESDEMVSEDPSDAQVLRADAFPGQGETVLVVEDAPRVRRLAVRRLAGLGYRVLEATDGPGALRLLGADAVDLLFSDMAMPGGMTGADLVRHARERRPGL